MEFSKENFLKWVSNPARTNDELFTVELLLEQSRGYGWPHQFVDPGIDARMQRAKERRANPAYRPSLHLEELRTLIETAEKKTSFSGGYGDRPLRDLSVLRFFPFLTNLSVQPSDVTDFTPVASLSRLTYFSIADYDDLYGCHPISLAQCGAMESLERLHLALRHPWPELRAMGDWPKLTTLTFNGAILALEEVKSLPAAREVALKSWPYLRGEPRNLQRLPAMPVVRQLTVEGLASLEGIERYPSALNLDLSGSYRDLSPLAGMEKVTALKLIGERFTDLRPLTAMQSLRELVLRREWPIDLSPLTDCPQLRRVSFEHSAMMRTEVAALNAALLPEAEDFFAPTPRPLPELKYYRVSKESAGVEYFRARATQAGEARVAYFDGDAALMKAETRVFHAAMQRRFDELLGRGWGIFETPFTRLKRFKDTTRLSELIEVVRDYQRRLLLPFSVTFIVEPHGDMTDEIEEIRAREEEETSADEDFLLKYHDEDFVLQENAEARERREERYERLKREHLFKLLGEEDPAALLSLSQEETEPEELDDEEEEDDDAFENEPQGEPDEEGGVAIAPPPPPPPKEEAEDSLSEALMFYLEVWEDCVTTNDNWVERAEYGLGKTFEEWTPPKEAEAGKLKES